MSGVMFNLQMGHLLLTCSLGQYPICSDVSLLTRSQTVLMSLGLLPSTSPSRNSCSVFSCDRLHRAPGTTPSSLFKVRLQHTQTSGQCPGSQVTRQNRGCVNTKQHCEMHAEEMCAALAGQGQHTSSRCPENTWTILRAAPSSLLQLAEYCSTMAAYLVSCGRRLSAATSAVESSCKQATRGNTVCHRMMKVR